MLVQRDLSNMKCSNIGSKGLTHMRGEFDERVTFHPWVGERYWTGNRFGIRLLVLGESHYAVEGYAVQGEEHPKVTIEAVRNHTQPDTEHFERNTRCVSP